MGSLNSYEMVLVHKEALIEYMKYAICVCQDCKDGEGSKGCKKANCKIHKAETILERDLYGNKNGRGK